MVLDRSIEFGGSTCEGSVRLPPWSSFQRLNLSRGNELSVNAA